MFYEIEHKRIWANTQFVFNQNDIWIPKLKYSLNKRKRWEILKCIYYQNDMLHGKIVLSITNINNNNGIFFGIFDDEQILSINHHKNFQLDRNSFCKNNKKGFLNIQSLQEDIDSNFDHEKQKKIVKKQKFSKRKNHRNLRVNNNSQQYIDSFENNYNSFDHLNEYEFLNITFDSIGIMKPKKIKSNKSKLKKLNKKLLEYEIKDSLNDYYSDKEYEDNLKIPVNKNCDRFKENQLNQESLPNVFLSEVIFENEASRKEISIPTKIPERDRPYTSMELQILVGDALSRAFIQLFEERPRDPINQLAKILYTMGNEFENSSNLLDSQMDTVSNLP